jgi:hypothetical protein
MSKIICIFCKQNRDRAKEHIWPKWLQKKMTGSTNWQYEGIHRSSFYFPLSVRTHTGERLVLGNVCAICNNGWMANLENHFIPILEKIQSKSSGLISLSKSERNILSIWAFKTCLVINAGSNYRRIIPPEHYQHLYDYKAIAKDVKVDLAYLNDYEKLKWIQAPMQFAITSNKEAEKNPQLLNNNNYNIAMQIGNFGMRVSWFKDCKAEGFEQLNLHDEKVLRIWPYQKNAKLNERNSFADLDTFHLSIYLRKIH